MQLTFSLRAVSACIATLCASAAFASSPAAPLPAKSQEVWAGPAPITQPSTLSRAEVLADLLLWKQAGLDPYHQDEGQMQHGGDYEKRLAHYRALRQSAAFTEALKSITGQP